MDTELYNSIFGILGFLNSAVFWWLVTTVIVALLAHFINRKGNPFL